MIRFSRMHRYQSPLLSTICLNPLSPSLRLLSPQALCLIKGRTRHRSWSLRSCNPVLLWTPHPPRRLLHLQHSIRTPRYALICPQRTSAHMVWPQLLAKHTALLASIAQSLTCQICLNGLHKPYALAPCGHVACRDCLVSWFSAPAPDAQGPDRRPVALRPKKCPHCRAVVEARPAEVWVLKEIAGAMARSGLAPEPIAAPPEPAHAEAQDPWEGIFPAPGGPRDARGVRDDEDGVWRCVDCFHEIWDGVCSGCERVYPDHEDEDEDAEADALLAALGERLDDEDGGWGQAPGAWPAAGAPRAGYRPWWARGMPNNGLLEPSDDEDDDDFIDDGPAYPAHWRVDNWPPLGYDPPDDDDEEDEDIDVEALPVPRRRVIDVDDEEEGYESDFIDDDDDDENGHHEVVDVDAVNAAAPDVVELDSDSDDEVPRPVRRVRALIPDDDDDDDDEVQILDPPARRGGRPYPIVVDSDEEGYADGEDLYVADAAEDPYVAPAQQDPYADEEDLYSAGTDSDEDEGSDDETDQLQYPESGDEQVEDDGSINRIPMRIARELGRGARI
jgi:hypothetical protein